MSFDSSCAAAELATLKQKLSPFWSFEQAEEVLNIEVSIKERTPRKFPDSRNRMAQKPQQQQQQNVAYTVEQLVAVNPYNPDILPDLENYVNEQVSLSLTLFL